jgi:hypothetical protein
MIKIKVSHIKKGSGWGAHYEGQLPLVGKSKTLKAIAQAVDDFLKKNGVVADVRVSAKKRLGK